MKYINFTTPIYYTNGEPHIGHTYTTFLADMYKKYYQLLGYEARLGTGTDEHGLKILKTANSKGITPIELVDNLSNVFQNYWKWLGVSYDDFIRTTESRHEAVAQEFWKILQDKGDIYIGEYDGLYCVACEQYYKESELLPGNICPIHEKKCDHLKEESYFFKLSKYQDKLINYIKENPNFIRPLNRRNEILGFLETEKLQDISISRKSFDWGIPVPSDHSHVMYVWFDALINYVSSLGGTHSRDFDHYWKNTYHFIGKDILRFHAVYWPAMLMALNLPLPKAIVAHGWWNIADKKISKSSQKQTGTIAEICDIVTKDGLRFYLTSDLSLERDGNFDIDNVIQVINSNLSNNLGNLFNRIIVLSKKYFNGILDYPCNEIETEWDIKIREHAETLKAEYVKNMSEFRHCDAINNVMQYCNLLNVYITDLEPWKLIKDPANERLVKKVLVNIAEGLRWVANLGYPFFPKISEQMNVALYQQEQFAIPEKFDTSTKIVQSTDILFKRIDISK